jgi:predicted nucleic acid-binding protein
VTDLRRDVAWADANPFVSLIIGTEHSTHEQALALFREIAEGRLQLIVTPVTVHEIVHVLESRYRRARTAIAEELEGVLQAQGLVVAERDVLVAALGLFGQDDRLAFAAAYLAASAMLVGPPNVASFDRDFDRIEGIRRTAS